MVWRNAVVAVRSAPKFRAECNGRRNQGSHGDYFRARFTFWHFGWISGHKMFLARPLDQKRMSVMNHESWCIMDHSASLMINIMNPSWPWITVNYQWLCMMIHDGWCSMDHSASLMTIIMNRSWSFMTMNHCELPMIMHDDPWWMIIHHGWSSIMMDDAWWISRWHSFLIKGVFWKQGQTENSHMAVSRLYNSNWYEVHQTKETKGETQKSIKEFKNQRTNRPKVNLGWEPHFFRPHGWLRTHLPLRNELFGTPFRRMATNFMTSFLWEKLCFSTSFFWGWGQPWMGANLGFLGDIWTTGQTRHSHISNMRALLCVCVCVFANRKKAVDIGTPTSMERVDVGPLPAIPSCAFFL